MTAPAPVGTVHDLGYKRYVGNRRPQSTRWRVIARNQIAMAWKTFWRFKLAVLFAAAVTIGFSIFLTIGWGKFTREMTTASPEDAMLAFAFGLYCRVATLASLTVGAMVIASDTQSGAFGFYFARPVRPVDYVLGKIAGMFFLMSMLMVVGPLILLGVRLGMYGSTSEVIAHLDLIPKMIGIGALTALGYAVIPLAFSAVVANRRYALALWAAYYFVANSIVGFTGRGSFTAGLDLLLSAQSLSYDALDVKLLRTGFTVSPWIAIGGIGVQVVVAAALVYFKVRSARESGVVGSG